MKDPIIVGMEVIEGTLRVGTPLCIPAMGGLEIGRVTSIEQVGDHNIFFWILATCFSVASVRSSTVSYFAEGRRVRAIGVNYVRFSVNQLNFFIVLACVVIVN